MLTGLQQKTKHVYMSCAVCCKPCGLHRCILTTTCQSDSKTIFRMPERKGQSNILANGLSIFCSYHPKDHFDTSLKLNNSPLRQNTNSNNKLILDQTNNKMNKFSIPDNQFKMLKKTTS